MIECIDTAVSNEQKEFEHFRRGVIDMQGSSLWCLPLPDQAGPFVQVREPPKSLQKEDHSYKQRYERNSMLGDEPGNRPKGVEYPFYLIQRTEYQPADAETQRNSNSWRSEFQRGFDKADTGCHACP